MEEPKTPEETEQSNPQAAPKENNNRGRTMLIIIIVIGVLSAGYLAINKWMLNSGENGDANNTELTENSVFVLTSVLNFRDDKTINAAVIQPLRFGDRLELIGSPESAVNQDDMSIVWQEASYNGQKGWIARSIDGQEVIGDKDHHLDYVRLFKDEYMKDAIYAEMKVWAYDVLIKWMKENDLHTAYRIRNDSKDIRKRGLKTIVSFPSDPDDRKSPDDYIVFLEHQDEFGKEDYLAVYIKSEGKNIGKVAGSASLEHHVHYLVEKKAGEMIPIFEYGAITMSTIENTMIGTADYNGSVTGWLLPNDDELRWNAERLVESNDAVEMLHLAGGADFGNENNWLDYLSGYTSDPKMTYEVTAVAAESKFIAVEKSKNFLGNYAMGKEIHSRFKKGRFITQDIDKAKLFIDIQENRLLLYLRKKKDDYGSTYFGLISTSYVENYQEERNSFDHYVDEDEEVGC